MRTIQLTKGKEAIVSDEDYEWLNELKWFYSGTYAATSFRGNKSNTYMHRMVNQTPDGFDTDHINRNQLDNRRENLRTVTRRQNELNKGVMSTNTSGVTGVSWIPRLQVWDARICVNYKSILLGRHKDIKDAIKARKDAEKLYNDLEQR